MRSEDERTNSRNSTSKTLTGIIRIFVPPENNFPYALKEHHFSSRQHIKEFCFSFFLFNYYSYQMKGVWSQDLRDVNNFPELEIFCRLIELGEEITLIWKSEMISREIYFWIMMSSKIFFIILVSFFFFKRLSQYSLFFEEICED